MTRRGQARTSPRLVTFYSQEGGTGPVRVQRAGSTSTSLHAIATTACPAGENIPSLAAALARRGPAQGAWDRLVADNPVSLRRTAVCATTRASRTVTAGNSNGAVRIHAVERFLGDRALRDGWRPLDRGTSQSGKRILIRGCRARRWALRSVPLAAALGHEVRDPTDRGPLPGREMLQFRDPRAVSTSQGRPESRRSSPD